MELQLDNLMAQETAHHLVNALRRYMTCHACYNIDGRFSNQEYRPVHIASGFVRENSRWLATLDITVVAAGSCGEKPATVIRFTEDDLLPWNIVDKILWPKYPHLFRCFSVPDSDWLETYGSDIDYPVRAQAVKLHRGAHVMPVGVIVTESGQHCYMLAVESGNGAFDNFSPTVLYPIGSFAQQTIPVETYDVAGW